MAAELRADENRRLELFPLAPWADPYYWNKAISRTAGGPIVDVLTSWDGLWYLRLVRLGYPTVVRPDVTYDVLDARAAFFPAYPWLVRTIDSIAPGGDVVAALGINLLLGGIFVYLCGLLARDHFGPESARHAMVFVAMFPGSFVLSFAYTEALLVVLAAGCLLALGQEKWLLAGLLAAVGTATRPNGLALVMACGIAAFVAIRRDRNWRALVALAFAPIGFVTFQWWLGRYTGEPGVWFRVQREAWGEGASYGVTALRRTWRAIIHPLSSPTNTVTAASVVTMAAMVWMGRRLRIPGAWWAYSSTVIVLMLLPATVTARPRFLFTAFPLVIAAAVWFAENRRGAWPWLLASCSVGLVALTTLYGVYGAIP
ncbi:MAG: hypothetical protein ACKOA2_07285 [Ilumatobacteraceae bacterium]